MKINSRLSPLAFATTMALGGALHASASFAQTAPAASFSWYGRIDLAIFFHALRDDLIHRLRVSNVQQHGLKLRVLQSSQFSRIDIQRNDLGICLSAGHCGGTPYS